jgi:hypothetical protein
VARSKWTTVLDARCAGASSTTPPMLSFLAEGRVDALIDSGDALQVSRSGIRQEGERNARLGICRALSRRLGVGESVAGPRQTGSREGVMDWSVEVECELCTASSMLLSQVKQPPGKSPKEVVCWYAARFGQSLRRPSHRIQNTRGR